MSEDKKIELSDDDKAIKKYRIILGIFALISGWILYNNIIRTKELDLLQNVCAIVVLSIFVYIYIWFYQKFLSRKDILRFTMYTILMIIFITFIAIIWGIIYIPFGPCSFSNIAQECATSEQACFDIYALCDERKDLQSSIWGDYFFITMFVLPLMALVPTIKESPKPNNNRYKTKILIFIIITLIIIFIPAIYYQITGSLLFNRL